MVRRHRHRRGRPRLARKLRQEDSFSLLELVVVISVLAILAAIAIPFFQSLVKQAAYVAGQWTLASATTTCAANKTLPIPSGFMGTQFSSSNPSDVCGGILTATYEDGCELSIDLNNGYKTSTGGIGWPETYELCEVRNEIAKEKIDSNQPDYNLILAMGEAGFTEFEALGNQTASNQITHADLDGDGVPEIISGGQGTLDIFKYVNGQWVKRTVRGSRGGRSLRIDALEVKDINGDGRPDIVYTSTTGQPHEIAYLINPSESDGSWNKVLISGSQSQPNDILLKDVDGDGDLDVIASASHGKTIHIYKNDGGKDGEWSYEKVTEVGDSDVFRVGIQGVEAADMDGDGDMDLVSSSFDQIIWYEKAGEGDWRKHIVAEDQYLEAMDLKLHDLNNDGKMDIVATNSRSNKVVMYANNGVDSDGFNEVQLAQTGKNPVGIELADLDGDGDLDMGVVSDLDQSVEWFRNDGSSDDPMFSESITLAGAGVDNGLTRRISGVSDIDTVDIDGDGDLDFLVGSNTGYGGNDGNRRIFVFKNDAIP